MTFNSKLHYIKIIFDANKFEKIKKDRAAKFVDILSGIGGAVGLLTGFSIISGVEILYFAARIMAKCCKKVLKNLSFMKKMRSVENV